MSATLDQYEPLGGNMNISNKNIISLIKAYTDRVEKGGKGGGQVEKGQGKTADEVTLSEFSQDIQRVKAGLDQIKDVREDRVKELKEKIAAGKYDVSGKDIAEKVRGSMSN